MSPRKVVCPTCLDYFFAALDELIARLDNETDIVAQFLEANGAQAITSGIAATIDTFCFAAASATGCDEVGGVYPTFHAMRCSEPILYLLFHCGLLSDADEFPGVRG